MFIEYIDFQYLAIMAKSAMVITPEEIFVKYAEIQAKRRVFSLEWVEKNEDRYRANLKLYYVNNKERLNARKKELRREQKEARVLAMEA
jgi:hypothetical protein